MEQDVIKQAEEIASQIKQQSGQGDGFQLPEKIGEFEGQKVNAALKEQFGFDLTEAVQFREAATKATEWKSQAEQAKQLQENFKGYVKPANPFVEKINNLYAQGKTEKEVKDFIRLQTLDANSLSDRDAIFQKEKMENPSLSEDHIKALIDAKYTVPTEGEDEEPDPAKLKLVEARLAKDAADARKLLQSQVANLSENLLNPNDPVKQEYARKQEQAYTMVAESVTDLVSSLSFGFKEGDFEYSFDYKLDLPEAEKKKVAAIVAKQAMGLNVKMKDYQQMQQMAETVIAVNYHRKATETALRDLYAKMLENKVKGNAGPQNPNGSVGSGGGQPVPDAMKARQAAMADGFV